MDILSDILSQIPAGEAQRQQRVARAKQDFFYFCQEYMGEAFPVDFAEYQRTLLRVVATRKIFAEDADLLKGFIKPEDHVYLKHNGEMPIEGLLDIEPRDHGKTTRNSQALPLWLALTQDGVFPVLIAASKVASHDLITSIKMELEHNDKMIDDFGEQRTSTWSKRKITLVNGNSIAAVGAGQSIRGIKDKYRRPTHVICDDLLKDNEINSKTLRNNIYTWFKRVVLNLGKGALTIVVNTILHPDDLPSRMLKEIEEQKLLNWVGMRFSAITPSGTALWPQRWPMEALERKRIQLGPFVFATEWMNEPMADEEKKFQHDWFQFYLPSNIDPRTLKKSMAIDPATGKASGDFSAIVVVGKDPATGLIYLLEAWAKRISDLALAHKIVELFLAHRPNNLVMEEVAFQAIYRRMVMREASRLGVHLPMKGTLPKINKETRIQSLAPLIESGLLLFRERDGLLMEQLEQFPKGHDDLPDALEMAVRQLESGFVGGSAVAKRLGGSVVQRLARLARGY